MPDIWTYHPEKLRGMLSEGGFSCGIEPRVFQGARDPEWTCGIDGPGWLGDIYIHPASQLWRGNEAAILLAFAFTIGAALGYAGGRRGT